MICLDDPCGGVTALDPLLRCSKQLYVRATDPNCRRSVVKPNASLCAIVLALLAISAIQAQSTSGDFIVVTPDIFDRAETDSCSTVF